MYYFFPKASVTVRNRKSPEDFIRSLRKDVEPPRGFRFFSANNLSFEGMVVEDQFRLKRINQVGMGGFATCDGFVDPAEDGEGCIIELNFSVRVVQIISIMLFAAFVAWQRRDALADPVTRMGSILFVAIAFTFMSIGSMVRFNLEVQRTCAIMSGT